jgi:hypothetical protein
MTNSPQSCSADICDLLRAAAATHTQHFGIMREAADTIDALKAANNTWVDLHGPAPLMPDVAQSAQVPAAYRVKDFADGWILCHTLEVAEHEADGQCLIQPLYAGAIPFSRPQSSAGIGGVRQKAEDAIRTFCQSLGTGSVSISSDGVERIYYAGINLKALSVAVALAVRDEPQTVAWRTDFENAPSEAYEFFLVRPQGTHPGRGGIFHPTIVQRIDGKFYTSDNELDPIYFGQDEPDDSPMKTTLEWKPLPADWLTPSPLTRPHGK